MPTSGSDTRPPGGDALRPFLLRLAAFGALFLAVDVAGSRLILRGLERYYGLDRPAPVLVVGHSRTVLGIDRKLLEERTGRRVAKYAIQGTTLQEHRVMLEQYLDRHPGAVESVVYVVDDYTFGKGFGTNQYRLFYPFMDSPPVDAYLRKATGGSAAYLARKATRLYRFNETSVLNAARMGYRGRSEEPPDGKADPAELRRKAAAVDTREQRRVLPENEEEFRRLVAFLRERHVRVVLFYMPFVDLLPPDVGGSREKALEIFRGMGRDDGGVVFHEGCATFSGRHGIFSDATHPNREGQALYTAEVARVLGGRNDLPGGSPR